MLLKNTCTHVLGPNRACDYARSELLGWEDDSTDETDSKVEASISPSPNLRSSRILCDVLVEATKATYCKGGMGLEVPVWLHGSVLGCKSVNKNCCHQKSASHPKVKAL